ncbi:MAG: general secretion pathway protein C [Comamonadaceae bacterium]|nr:MAG: general secretion pathway protein C [Comamonadaceae bacterium]
MSVPYAPARWPVATTTAVLWAVAGASVVFWSLRLLAPADGARPPVVPTAPAAQWDAGAVARMLGAQPEIATASAAPDAASRFQLQGVVADDLGRGAALIAIDGKPARPYRAGALLTERFVLQAVDRREVRIGADHDGQALFTLRLPALEMAPNGLPRPLPRMDP